MFSWVELLLAKTLTSVDAKPIAATMTRTASTSGYELGRAGRGRRADHRARRVRDLLRAQLHRQGLRPRAGVIGEAHATASNGPRLDGLDLADGGVLRRHRAAAGGMGVWEWRSPGGAPRRGILGLITTRGDRLFISLLGRRLHPPALARDLRCAAVGRQRLVAGVGGDRLPLCLRQDRPPTSWSSPAASTAPASRATSTDSSPMPRPVVGDAEQVLTCSRRRCRPATSPELILALLGDLDPEVTDGAFELGVAERKLDRSEIPGAPIDQLRLGSGHGRRPTRGPAVPPPSIPAVASRLHGTRGWSTP